MNSERWQQIKKVFNDALQCEPSQREAFLAKACPDDGELLAEVEKLLNSYAADFMTGSAIGEVADVIVDTPRLRAGQRLGRYRIVQPIGKGGMGEVYLAHDTELERDVALKILAAEAATVQQSMQRFTREAKTASALNHPNIITIHEVGEAEGLRFIATEYIKGENLRQRLGRGQLSLPECFEIAAQVASALAAAHEAKVIHRDIKPENIMLRPDGLVKVLDFGLAKLTERGTAESSDPNTATRQQINTAPGMVMGTVNYMSPEQVRGQDVDARSDIWSFGVVLYELVTGRKPFAGESPSDVIAAILKNEPARLGTIAPGAPAELQRITWKAIRKERDERYQTARDLLLDLKSLARELALTAELERSMPSQLSSGSGVATSSSTPPAQALAATGITSESARTASSAEYIVTQIRTYKRSVLFALAMLLIAAAAVSYFAYFKRKAPALTEQDTILIADFDNKTGDAVFDGTLKQGLAVQLGQSPFLNLFPDARVRDTLKLMNRSPDERVTIDMAREICERNGVKALIAGAIAPLGSHYVITLEAINGHSGEVVGREQTEAEGKEQVLKALSTAAGSLREKLGESLSSIQKFDKPLEDTTSSLEALKAYSQGFDIQLKGQNFEAMPFFRRAIELDENFALAYGLLAWMYSNTGQKKSGSGIRRQGLCPEGSSQRRRAFPSQRAILSDDYRRRRSSH